ncbi:MAG TPA: hypothetical protein VLV31_04580 [Candidatus Acidoferrales bacterium]|nr:hypothetical protein [Candidatus Acidoferrales bacterium]
MRKIVFTLLIFVLVCSTSGSLFSPVKGIMGNAVILSSLDSTMPFNYYGLSTEKYLQSMGYTVTMLKNQQVTLDLITSGLSSYNIIIWRTDDYTYAHRMFWYAGEHANQHTLAKYEADVSSNLIDVHAGILGLSLDFFQKYLTSQSLRNVKLMILLSSDSNSIAPIFISAGAAAVIYCMSQISLQFGIVDDLATQIVAYLSQGDSVLNALWTTISPYLQNQTPEDPLDSTYSPPFWYLGNGNLTLT